MMRQDFNTLIADMDAASETTQDFTKSISNNVWQCKQHTFGLFKLLVVRYASRFRSYT